MNRFVQGRAVEIETPGKKPQVVKILHPAVRDSKFDHRLEFFRYHGIDGIRANVRSRKIEQRGEDALFRRGCHRVAGAEIDLQWHFSLAELSDQAHPHAAVGVGLPDMFDPDGIGLENEAVCGNGRFHNLTEDGRNVFQLVWPEGEEIDILGRPVSFLVPQGKQHRAFEEKLVGVPGLTEAVKQSLDAKAHHEEIERLVAPLRHGEQGRPRRGQVLGFGVDWAAGW